MATLNGTENSELLIGNGIDEDVINALEGDDTIQGAEGFSETIDGGAGRDTLSYANSSVGVDVSFNGDFSGDEGGTASTQDGVTDNFVGIEGIVGSAHGDYLEGGLLQSTALQADGGAGNDYISGGQSDDTLVGGDGDDTLNGGDGSDIINAGTGNDEIWLGSYQSGTDVIDGGIGQDRIVAGGVIDLAAGTVSPDGVNNTSSYATLIGIEDVEGDWTEDFIQGDGNANILIGGDGADTILGGGGNDTLYGDREYDGSIAPEFDNDVLNGEAGDDYIRGGAGSGTFIGGAGNDTIDGGDLRPSFYASPKPEDDPEWVARGVRKLVDYADSSGAVDVNLATGISDDGMGGVDTLININFVRGSANNDVITGSGDSDKFEWFEGGAGNDVIDGGSIDAAQSNNNRVHYGNATAGVSINLESGTATDGQGGTDTLININQVNGSSHADTLIGSNRTDVDEQYFGGVGNDSINGMAGEDRLDYTGSTGGINAMLAVGTVSDGQGGEDAVSGIEHVRGTAYDDTILGNANDNKFEGASGNDLLGGAEGNDTLFGGGGNDSLSGGAGDDLIDGLGVSQPLLAGNEPVVYGQDFNVAYYADATSAVNVNLGAGSAQGASSGNDTLLNIQAVRGSNHDDTLIGSNTTDIVEEFEGGAGNDTIDGQGGLDVVRYGGPSGPISVNFGSGEATGAGVGTDTLSNVEGVAGSTHNDTITGGAGFEFVDYANASAGAVVTLGISGTGSSGGSDTDTLNEVDGVRGSAHDDVLTGSERDEWFSAGLGHNTISGGDGVDWVDYQQFDAVVNGFLKPGVEVNLASGTAINEQNFGSGSETDLITDTLSGIENVRGTRFYDQITGDEGDNRIEGLDGGGSLIGGGGNDTIIGGAGNGAFSFIESDFIDGGDGNDSLMGEAGTDEFRGGSGNDFIDGGLIVGDDVNGVIYGDSMAGVVVNLDTGVADDGMGGTDTLVGINKVEGSAHGDTLSGSATANRIETFIGGDGVDQIDGGTIDAAGSNGNLLSFTNTGTTGGVVVNLGTGLVTDEFGNAETIANINMVKGTYGDDVLTGSNSTARTEVFYVTEGNDTIDGMGGEDTLSLLYAPFGTVDLAQGTAEAYGGAIEFQGIEHVEGSGYRDNISGSSSANRLDGGDRDDWLEGRGGNDTLIGGAGSDDAVYHNAGAGIAVDLVLGSASDGDGGTDTLSGIENVYGSEHDDNIIANDEANWLVGEGGSDNIFGGAGADTLWGGSGSDTLRGGEDDDQLHGGFGNDVLEGGFGDDSLTGEDGDDAFRLSALDGGVSVASITDFGRGNDRIELDNTVFTALSQTGALGSGSFVSGNFAAGINLAAQDADDRVLYDSATGSLYYDQDGNGASAAVQIAHVLSAGGSSTGLTSAQIFVTDGTEDGNGAATEGNDTLVGGPGDDTINGLAGNDSLDGGPGGDVLNGGAGADTYVGGDGYDTVSFEGATQGVRASLVTGVIQNDGFGNVESISGVEAIQGSRFGDVIVAGDGDAFGRAGNDSLTARWVNGGSGNDTLTGSGPYASLSYWDDGFDTAGVATHGVVVSLATGTATDSWGNTDRFSGIANVEGSAYADRITGNSSDNDLFGGSGSDTLDGGAGNDFLEGRDGNDNLVGGAGNDFLYGWDGNDTMLGGTGSDTFEGGAGNDTMDGGVVTDTVNLSDLNLVTYAFASSGVDVNLEEGTAQDGDGGTDTLANINFVTGSDFDDRMIGSAGSLFEQFEGGAGNDTINGSLSFYTTNGTNRVTYVNAPEGIDANLATGEIQDGYGDTDTVSNIQWVRGSSHGDRMVGSDTTAWTEVFEGRAGNDTIDGAGGFDMVRFNAAIGPVNVNFATGVAQDGQGGTDMLSNIEGVRGSIYADTLTGGNAANDGFEFFQGDAGNDTIDGGTGFDRADFTTATAAATVTLGGTANGTALDGQGGTDTLISVEAVRGSSFNDRLNGSDSGTFESFEGMAGNDTLDGKGGIDRADYVGSAAAVQASLLSGVASDGFGGTDRLVNIENLGGSSFADTLTGSAGANRIDGRAGSDKIDGKGGVDTLDGGQGADKYLVGAASDHSAAEFVDSGDDDGLFDSVWFTASSASTLTLFAGDTGIEIAALANSVGQTTGTTALNIDASQVGNTLEILGNNGANQLIGTAFDDSILGNGGNDRLDGRGGDDQMWGGTGNDTYLVDSDDDVVNEETTSIKEIDTVESSLDWTLGINLENLTLTGSDDLVGTGNALANTLKGNDGDNELKGEVGNDNLSGGVGNDTLNGGVGSDTMFGGAGDDTYLVDSTGDRVYESTTTSGKVDAGGTDTVNASVNVTLSNFVENLELADGAGNLSGTGNALGNEITGNEGANVIDGKGGVDTLDGGEGSDVYLVASGAEHTAAEFDDAGSGVGDVDQVRFTSTTSGSTLTLHAEDSGIERVVVGNAAGATTGTTSLNVDASAVDNALEIVGNAGANRLTGTENADTLLGNGGSDRLDGGEGVDAMTGGSGNDTYVVDDAADQTVETGTSTKEVDTVESTIDWTLQANTENLVLLGEDDIDGTGNELANTITGNNGNNLLDGGLGNNKLVGLGGNDTLKGGVGADQMLGGAGNDVYIVDNLKDTVVETTKVGGSTDALGTDRVESSVTWTLGKFVENLELTGSGNINGTGNTLANEIEGNAGNNLLNGGAGSDTLTGGGGDDIFRFATTLNASTNLDTVTDFGGGDKIQLENSVFTKLKTSGVTSNNFVSGDGAVAADADDYLVYDTADSTLYYDSDGSGVKTRVAFADLDGANISHSDFLVT